MAATTRHYQFGRRAVRALALSAILSLLALGCSVRNNYKTLSFFFDGVPDPNAPAASAGLVHRVAAPNGELEAVKMYRHQPYAEGKCQECHTADKKRLLTVKAELCLKCHAPTVKQYPVMHVPVELGQCLWCHEPHESDSPQLLKTTAPQLCLQCHDVGLLPSNIKPHLSPEKANCLVCHVGHGGAKPSLLRVDNPTVAPIMDRLNAAGRGSSTQASPAGGAP